jgi:hypothetical protein
MDAAGRDVIIRLRRDEALVLSAILHRWDKQGRVNTPEHHAEQIALWNLSCMLEAALAESFDPAGPVDRGCADAPGGQASSASRIATPIAADENISTTSPTYCERSPDPGQAPVRGK